MSFSVDNIDASIVNIYQVYLLLSIISSTYYLLWTEFSKLFRLARLRPSSHPLRAGRRAEYEFISLYQKLF